VSRRFLVAGRESPVKGGDALEVAAGPDNMNLPSLKLHSLKGDLRGHWSVWVNGNWRITFRFIGTDVELVDYQD
jgi:proteic killer suppression protein